MQFDEKALEEVREGRLLINAYDSWLLEEMEPFLGMRIVEVGCGLGNLLSNFKNRELAVGIDNSKRTIEVVKDKFSNFKNVLAFEYNIADSSVLSLKTLRFDTAVSLNVFEHIENDDLALNHTSLLLQPNGYFIFIVPAHQWLYGTMDKSIGHYRRYTKTVVKEKLERSGFKVISQKYLNTFGAIGWFINGKLFKQNVPPAGQLKIFNKIVPILKRIEKIFPPLFGITLLTVAQRNQTDN